MKIVESLALIGGYVDVELLIRNEYLAAEDEILKSIFPENSFLSLKNIE